MQKLLAMFSLLQFLFLHISTTFDIFACITLRKHFIHRPFQWMKNQCTSLYSRSVTSVTQKKDFSSFCCQTFDIPCVLLFHKKRIFFKTLAKIFWCQAQLRCKLDFELFSLSFNVQGKINNEIMLGKSGFGKRKKLTESILDCCRRENRKSWKEFSFAERLFAQEFHSHLFAQKTHKTERRKVINSPVSKDPGRGFHQECHQQEVARLKCFLKHFRWDLFSSACAFSQVYLARKYV